MNLKAEKHGVVTQLRGAVGLVQGIIGEGYKRMAVTTAAATADDFKFNKVEAEYKMDGYFSTAHKHNAFGAGPAAATGRSKRRLIERVNVAFPLRCYAGGVPSGIAEASPGFSKFPTEPRRRLIEAVTLRRRMFLWDNYTMMIIQESYSLYYSISSICEEELARNLFAKEQQNDMLEDNTLGHT
jgi:hypothetical protein